MTVANLVTVVLVVATVVSVVTAHAGFQAWKDTALTPKQRAAAIVAEMTVDEKILMLHGSDADPYTGLVPANNRLGIPAVKMNDGPQVRLGLMRFVCKSLDVVACCTL